MVQESYEKRTILRSLNIIDNLRIKIRIIKQNSKLNINLAFMWCSSKRHYCGFMSSIANFTFPTRFGFYRCFLFFPILKRVKYELSNYAHTRILSFGASFLCFWIFTRLILWYTVKYIKIKILYINLKYIRYVRTRRFAITFGTSCSASLTSNSSVPNLLHYHLHRPSLSPSCCSIRYYNFVHCLLNLLLQF